MSCTHLNRMNETLAQDELCDVEPRHAHLGMFVVERLQHLLQVQLYHCAGHPAARIQGTFPHTVEYNNRRLQQYPELFYIYRGRISY